MRNVACIQQIQQHEFLSPLGTAMIILPHDSQPVVGQQTSLVDFVKQHADR
jgi:hypothetical protein